jgi:hypothetical protein
MNHGLLEWRGNGLVLSNSYEPLSMTFILAAFCRLRVWKKVE